jgi:phosphatidylinositol phospholipase C delta
MNSVRQRSMSSTSNGTVTPTRKFSLPKAADVTNSERKTAKMSFALAALVVYTVGVKCRGINKKEKYAPEHIFSLSENTANKYLKHGVVDLIKHNRAHLVRIYPRGTRLNSTNYEPHRYWPAGAQLVAINWQTYGASGFFSCLRLFF